MRSYPPLAVELRTAEDLTEPGGDPLGVIGGHAGEQRGDQGILGHVLLVEDAGHPGQRRQAAGPGKQGRFLIARQLRVRKADVVVHA
jgi:hypothetical protein